MSGTTGLAKRLEGVKISLPGQDYTGEITYQTHVQTYGWQDWVKNGALAGTTGESKRLEGIRIKLTGEMAEHYDIYYRVHSQTYGWLGWAKRRRSRNGRLIQTSGGYPDPVGRKRREGTWKYGKCISHEISVRSNTFACWKFFA